MKSSIFIIFFLFCCNQAFSAGKIKYYFNHRVDTSVSTGVNAIDLSGYIDDTLVGYINRAKYTIDVAVYNFTISSITHVASAINAAHRRGVKVRWIYDGSSTNSGLGSLDTSIRRLGSPTSTAYTIMHHKFMIVDANSNNPDDAIVWTGASNWSNNQFNNDYDNFVILQDSALAKAYLGQFNMMWGDTGMAPNTTNSKFGSFKTDLGKHEFVIDGKRVELYFSPSDNTNAKIVNAINSANTDLYFGMYTFTYNTNATSIVNRKNAGVYVAGIIDTFSYGNSAYSILSAGLGSALKVYGRSYLYHNKYLIVDASDPCSDPLVLTGSHNWSVSANTDNDENTLIIHDDTAANIFYQSFRADYANLGGALTVQPGCATSVPDLQEQLEHINVFPNPTNGVVHVNIPHQYQGSIAIKVTTADGRLVYEQLYQATGNVGDGLDVSLPKAGLYFITVVSGLTVETSKIHCH